MNPLDVSYEIVLDFGDVGALVTGIRCDVMISSLHTNLMVIQGQNGDKNRALQVEKRACYCLKEFLLLYISTHN